MSVVSGGLRVYSYILLNCIHILNEIHKSVINCLGVKFLLGRGFGADRLKTNKTNEVKLFI